MNRYIITETSGYTSLDPLDADQTQNLPVARMIYTTPLEINTENSLSSLVLESFSYDNNTRTISWTVKNNLKFNDGSPMTVEDVAFSVTRMLYARPKFPVLENIDGLDKWIKSNDPLKTNPSGIKIDGQKISIKLTKSHAHPLFRFCLELFSIIPKKCVDLKTNKISCSKLPGSGYYKIVDQSTDKVLFERSSQATEHFSGPDQIEFKYIPSAQLTQRMDEVTNDAVVAGNEVSFSSEELNTIRSKLITRDMSASRFAMLLINPTVGVFKDKLCRQLFVQEYRKNFAQIAGDAAKAESSIFVSVVPGYMKDSELSQKSLSKIKTAEIEKCRAQLKSAEIHWGYAKNEKSSSGIQALIKTLETLGIKTKASEADTRKALSMEFSAGKIAVYNAGSGFWPLDPSGDVKMLFTPQLHEILKFVSNDKTLQTLIDKVQGDEANVSAYKEINQYLYDEATFAVYAHVRRFFAAKNKNLLPDFPAAITSPSPWQVFQGK